MIIYFLCSRLNSYFWVCLRKVNWSNWDMVVLERPSWYKYSLKLKMSWRFLCCLLDWSIDVVRVWGYVTSVFHRIGAGVLVPMWILDRGGGRLMRRSARGRLAWGVIDMDDAYSYTRSRLCLHRYHARRTRKHRPINTHRLAPALLC